MPRFFSYYFFIGESTDAPNGSWTHNLTLQPIIMREGSVGWAIAHWQLHV